MSSDVTYSPDDRRHGTYNGHRNLGCRCDRCKAAAVEYRIQARARRQLTGPPEHVHGTLGGYTNYGCRCARCGEAQSLSRRAYLLRHPRARKTYAPISQIVGERWRPVSGWEGFYEVSDHGRVRSVQRRVTYRHTKGGPAARVVPARIRRPHAHPKTGHLMVSLSRNGRQVSAKVHRMVLEAFVGPCPPGMEGCHGNDVSTDNRLGNLRWDTHTGNMRDLVRNGNHHQASKTRCKRDHEFTPENTIVTRQAGRSDGRRCRTCTEDENRRKYLDRKTRCIVCAKLGVERPPETSLNGHWVCAEHAPLIRDCGGQLRVAARRLGLKEAA